MSCGKTKFCGPGYASPKEAMKGPREKVLFVTCAHASPSGNDMLAAIDVDPDSKTFCQILSKVVLPHQGDEIHHSGWNACSSCHGNPSANRTHMVLPCLNSSRVYIVNVENERAIRLEKGFISVLIVAAESAMIIFLFFDKMSRRENLIFRRKHETVLRYNSVY
ncbi:hypothetical protein Aduo_013774 [Ancylostoma duodenale]